MKKETKPKIKITGKASTSGGPFTGNTLKLNPYGQPLKSGPSHPKKQTKKK
jgi:hypothetical protein